MAPRAIGVTPAAFRRVHRRDHLVPGLRDRDAVGLQDLRVVVDLPAGGIGEGDAVDLVLEGAGPGARLREREPVLIRLPQFGQVHQLARFRKVTRLLVPLVLEDVRRLAAGQRGADHREKLFVADGTVGDRDAILHGIPGFDHLIDARAFASLGEARPERNLARRLRCAQRWRQGREQRRHEGDNAENEQGHASSSVSCHAESSSIVMGENTNRHWLLSSIKSPLPLMPPFPVLETVISAYSPMISLRTGSGAPALGGRNVKRI